MRTSDGVERAEQITMKYEGHGKQARGKGSNMVCYIPLVDFLYCTDGRNNYAPSTQRQ